MLLRLFLFNLLLSTSVLADTVRMIERDDGTIEFSNVKNSGHKLTTQNKKTAQTLIYKSQSGEAVIFSDQKPLGENITYEVLKFDCYACNPHSKVNWNTVKLNTTAYANPIEQASQKYNVDSALVRALIHAESSFNPTVTSRMGAQGLMQLMPATAKELGVNNSLNAQQNINGGVKYLSQLLNDFNGNIRLATAAYNAGPNAVKKYNGIPPYQETEVYVERVGILHKRYRK